MSALDSHGQIVRDFITEKSFIIKLKRGGSWTDIWNKIIKFYKIKFICWFNQKLIISAVCSVVLLGLTEVISWLLYFKLCQCRTQTYLRTVKSVWASKNWVQTFQNKVCEKTSGNAFQANPVISNSKNFTDRAPDHG